MTTEYTKIQIIWDRDHGPENEGWYARSKDASGSIEDYSITSDWDTNRSVDDATIINWALGFYSDPDGMSRADLDNLESLIEIKR